MSAQRRDRWAAVQSLLPSGGSNWDVFGIDGRYLSVVVMPEGFSAFEFRADQVFGV